MMLAGSDLMSIERVVALYGHLVDARAWERFDEVFTEDASFDATALDLPVLAPRRAIQDGFAAMSHPVAHLTTNVVVDGTTGDGTEPVGLRSKWLCPLRGGKVLTGEYHDTVARTPDGWRIRTRHVVALRPRAGTL